MKTEDEQTFLWRLFKEAREYKGTLTQGIDYYVFHIDCDGLGEPTEEFVGRIRMPDYTTHQQCCDNQPLVEDIVAKRLHAYCTLFNRRKEDISLRRMMRSFPVTFQEVSKKTYIGLGMRDED